jgi:hypothetical protein
LPALSPVRTRSRVVNAHADAPELMQLLEHERHILLKHAALGCDALMCITDRSVTPFVFKTRRVLKVSSRPVRSSIAGPTPTSVAAPALWGDTCCGVGRFSA